MARSPGSIRATGLAGDASHGVVEGRQHADDPAKPTIFNTRWTEGLAAYIHCFSVLLRGVRRDGAAIGAPRPAESTRGTADRSNITGFAPPIMIDAMGASTTVQAFQVARQWAHHACPVLLECDIRAGLLSIGPIGTGRSQNMPPPHMNETAMVPASSATGTYGNFAGATALVRRSMADPAPERISGPDYSGALIIRPGAAAQ